MAPKERAGHVQLYRTIELFRSKMHRSMEEVLARKRRHRPAVEARYGEMGLLGCPKA